MSLPYQNHSATSYAAARVAELDAGTKRSKILIDYLWRNKHTSPFESVCFTFEIHAPIFTFRQWHRHRTWSYNEVSARYTELPEVFYLPTLDQITTQSESNKQMRTGVQHPDAEYLQWIIKRSCRDSFATYQELIAAGCPRELARATLPLGTYSRMFASVDLLNLFKFITSRAHEHSQHEIRVYADAMLKLIEPIVPVAVTAFRRYAL